MANLTSGWVIGLLRHLLGTLAEDTLRKTMEQAQGKVVAGMVSKHMAPPEASVAACAHDALFRLWKAVVRSGDLADIVRDAQNGVVVPLVVAQFPEGSSTPATLVAVVEATREAALAQVFL